MNLHIHEVQKTPKMLNLKKSTQRYITIKLSKVRDKENFGNSKRSDLSHTRNPPIRLPVVFLAETAGQGEWDDTFNILKEKKLSTMNITPSKAVLQR